MQAPKNGFFYVIDRSDGKLISAEPYVTVTWASKTDLKTGLVYIPAVEFKVNFSEPSPSWRPATDRNTDAGANMIGGPLIGEKPPAGALIAWSAVTQKQVWRVDYPTYLNGGVKVTGGDLVFQGTVDGMFKAFAATDGALLWSFDARRRNDGGAGPGDADSAVEVARLTPAPIQPSRDR